MIATIHQPTVIRSCFFSRLPQRHHSFSALSLFYVLDFILVEIIVSKAHAVVPVTLVLCAGGTVSPIS